MTQYTNIELETFLDDFEQRSEIVFLEDAKQTDELFAIAKAKGILAQGSRDLAIFKAVYTFADKQNANGVTIPEQELLRKLPTVVGKPVTLEHVRRFVIGFVIDYRYIAKEKTAIIYGVIFKNCFKSEWENAVKLFGDHKLAVSSEIWAPKTKREYVSPKEYKIYDIEFAGCTLVFVDKKNKPAFSDASVLEMAKKNYEEQEELIYAMVNKEKFESNVTDNDELIIAAVEAANTSVQQPVSNQPTKMKIVCQHCGNNFEHLFVQGQNNPINCPNCSAIVDQVGKVIYPPQIKNFDLSCPNCLARNNWLTVASQDNEARVQCNSCKKEYSLKFKNIPKEYLDLLGKFTFLRMGQIPCIQCGTYNTFSIPSSQEKVEIKCKKCGLPFSFDIEDTIKRDIESVEEYKELPINEEDKKMTVLEETKLGVPKTDEERVQNHFKISSEDWDKLSKEQKQEYISKLPKRGSGLSRAVLRKAVKKMKQYKDTIKEKENEANLHKAKVEKYANGIKSLSKQTRDLREKTKTQELETAKLKKELEDTKIELETAKQKPIEQPVEEPKLEIATANVGDASKTEQYYAETRKAIDEKAFGHLHR